jgi:glycosyltransferase involved in cell wall biosynthesis
MGENMKIMHLRNMANVSYNISIEQKKMNHLPFIFEIIKNPRNIKNGDVYLNLPLNYERKEIFNRYYTISNNLLRIILKERFDIFHLHDAGILPHDIDIPLIFKLFGKVVVHWHGSKLRKNGKTFGSGFADAKIVATPDLLEYSPEAIWIPNCIPWHGLSKIDRIDDKIIIGHAPTDRFYKGTKHFLEAMDELKTEYPNVECLLIENKSHMEALRLLQTCDVVVDSVGLGWYGVLTNEVQQMGIPCCVTIKPELEQFIKEPSGIVNVSPENIKQKLEELILDESLRFKLGTHGKEYVNKVHNNEKIAKKIQTIYDST